MTVFNNYFKIIKEHKFSMVLYSVIFIVIMALFASTDSGQKSSYSSVNVPVYIEDNSQSDLSKALVNYLEKNTRREKLDPKLADDELFYGTVSANIIIPEDFEDSNKINFKSAPQNMYNMLISQKINQFLNKVNAYESAGYPIEDAIKYSNEDLNKKAEVTLVQGGNPPSVDAKFYFNFANYPLMAQIILIVSTLMVIYNKDSIARRNEVSSMPKASQNLQLIFGHVVMGIVVWAFYMVLYGILFSKSLGERQVHLMMLNSFVFTITLVTMAVFLSQFLKNEGILQAVMNVVSLGSSFLSGAFIPQFMLSDLALKLGRIFPSFYFISNNEIISDTPEFSAMIPNILIMLGFSLAFILLTLINPKRKTISNK